MNLHAERALVMQGNQEASQLNMQIWCVAELIAAQ